MHRLYKPIATNIVKRNYKKEISYLSEFACRSDSAIRKKKEKVPDRKNIRPAFF